MDKKYKNISFLIIMFFVMLIILMILFFVNIFIGSTSISFGDILNLLIKRNGGTDSSVYKIILDIRLPRLLSAMILGGMLSVSGFLLQTFFANPIAGPFILGISSGAKLVVALFMVAVLSKGRVPSSYGLIFAAFGGSMLATAFVLAASGKVKNMSVLVICGVMIGYICSSVTEFVVAFADDSNIVNLHNWSLGSFSGMSWDMVRIMWVLAFISILICVFIMKPMQAYQMGESYARSLGVNIVLLKTMIILISSILSACVTAFAGPVSFVGVAVPHLMKNLFKTVKPMVMIPASFLGGGIMCLFCDMIARSLFAPMEISISSVTAVFGAPIVMYIMLKGVKYHGR